MVRLDSWACYESICVCLTNRNVSLKQSPMNALLILNLVDVSEMFYFFCSRGKGGKGSPRHQEEAGSFFLLKIPGGGGGSTRRGARDREGVCGELGGGG